MSGGVGRKVAGPFLVGAVGVAVLAGVWEFAVAVFDIQAFVLQPPSTIFRTFVDDPGLYIGAAITTSWHAGLALFFSLLISVALGSMLASSRLLEEAVQPLLTLILVAPWIAYFGSLQVQFGIGDTPLLILATAVTVPAPTFAMVAGLRSVDPAAVELFESVAASRAELLFRLRLPSALPTLLATARFNAGLALAAIYYAEGFGTSQGLGHLGKSAINSNNGPRLWTTIVVTAVLGFTFLALITLFERTALRWHASQRDLA